MKSLIERSAAFTMDSVMCGMMNVLQWRRRDQMCTKTELEIYLSACAGLTREQFYNPPPASCPKWTEGWLEWDTPYPSGFPQNDRPRARLYPCSKGFGGAPTVIILHALMSANDIGYAKVARWFNTQGWNAVFPHLPFHYSRTPRGYLNGELAITANLIRNGEALRQGVSEVRQLMGELRSRGCTRFGVLGTSYGGWTGALLSFLEDLNFLALIQPIVNVEHAIWENPGAASMRRLLRQRGIAKGESSHHAHLSSPLHGLPLCNPSRIVITGGLYDLVSPTSELLELTRRWPDSKLIHVRQGHFGYTALRETLKEVVPFL